MRGRDSRWPDHPDQARPHAPGVGSDPRHPSPPTAAAALLLEPRPPPGRKTASTPAVVLTSSPRRGAAVCRCCSFLLSSFLVLAVAALAARRPASHTVPPPPGRPPSRLDRPASHCRARSLSNTHPLSASHPLPNRPLPDRPSIRRRSSSTAIVVACTPHAVVAASFADCFFLRLFWCSSFFFFRDRACLYLYHLCLSAVAVCWLRSTPRSTAARSLFARAAHGDGAAIRRLVLRFIQRLCTLLPPLSLSPALSLVYLC